MKLSDKEVELITDFLKCVPSTDLYSLVATVTNGLIEAGTIDDAIHIIILHSEDPKSLLHRRKITKDVLFKYLHKLNVDIQISLEKHTLVEKVLEFWNSTSSPQHNVTNNEVEASLPTASVESGTISQCNRELSAGSGISEGEVNELAQKFSEWFSSLLNEHQVETEGSQLGVEHFWPDCSLQLSMISPSNSVDQEVHQDAASVVQLLGDTKVQHNLYFNPNLSSEGVRGMLDPHGLVVVVSCGTLHQLNKCVGIYEQVFALARDPFSLNNWKIKKMKVRLKNVECVNEQPTLQQGELLRCLTGIE